MTPTTSKSDFVEQRARSGAPVTILASSRYRAVVCWIPYLGALNPVGAKKSKRWLAVFNGGEVEIDLDQMSVVMFYGATDAAIPLRFLHDASHSDTGVIIHSSRATRPIFFTPAPGPDRHDILSAQIRFRDNQRKRLVIARALLQARAQQMGRLITISDKHIVGLREASSIEALRSIEAHLSSRYWKAFFSTINHPEWHRRDDNPAAKALDAISAFQAGLLLRWVTLHRLSPSHGYLHEPSGYPALLYDLIEPCRHLGERAVLHAWQSGARDEALVGASINAFKDILSEWAEVPSLQVEATHKSIMHGHVLALRAYLSGEMIRLNLPIDEQHRSRGRPVKVSYQIPGARVRRR